MEILKILLLIYLLYKDFKFIKLKKYNVKLINVNKNEKEKENNIIAKNPIKDIFFNNNSVIDDFNDFIKEDSIQNNIYKYNILNSPYKNKTKIPIAFGVDNNYIYPLIVLLTSILWFHQILVMKTKKRFLVYQKNIHKNLNIYFIIWKINT